MPATDTRSSEWGANVSAALVRDFVETAIRHDALIDFVNEYVFDGVQSGTSSPAEIAEALRVAIHEILDTARPEDWQHIAQGLIANAEDALGEIAAVPVIAEGAPPIGTDFLPVAQNAKVRQRRLTSARIMAAAEELSSEQPEEKLSLFKIAPRAEISLGTIFQRFADKPGLLAGMRAQRVLRIEKLWAERDVSPGTSAFGQILAAAEEYLQVGSMTLTPSAR